MSGKNRTKSAVSATVGALAACLVLLYAPAARAQCGTACTDSSGVVNPPAGLDLSLPFAPGETVKILSGYGPNAGSSLHCRTKDPGCANDFFALDLVLPNHPNSGKGQPVLAAASGTVIAAGWGSSGWAAYGQRVYIKHDYGADGHAYTSLYAHLDVLNVAQGQKVKKGDLIGTLGQSCNGAKSCANFSTPHLHFSVHRDSSFGGSGSGGSYAGRAVRPEPIDGVTGIQQGQTHTSKNGQSTPPPPATCDLVIPHAETTIEDDTPCLVVTGSMSDSSAGLGGHALVGTLDTPDPDYAKGGTWLLNFAQAGNYDLFAWIPGGVSNLTAEAVYKVQHGSAATKVGIDQGALAGGWAHLGAFAFAAGASQWVRLGDNYVQASNQGKTFVVDALRVAPAASAPDAGAPIDGGGAGSNGWPDAGSSIDGSPGLLDSGVAGAPPGAAPNDDSAGCACRTAPARRGVPLGALALAVLALAASRRRQRAT